MSSPDEMCTFYLLDTRMLLDKLRRGALSALRPVLGLGQLRQEHPEMMVGM